MSIVEVFLLFSPARSGRGVLALGLAGLLSAHGAWAQSSEAVTPTPVVDSSVSDQTTAKPPALLASQPVIPRIASLMPRWSQLTPVQQQALSPLAGTWDTLGDGHRRKWIALAQNFLALPAAEQIKLHSRMAEWAALNPRERELARFNFAETKKLPVPDRAANWEAYKALSPEERKQWGNAALTKPKGAASTKPVAPGKLTIVPVTRNTPMSPHQLEALKQAIDPHTLLPKKPRSPN